MVYPALLPLMRTPRLPAVDWTDAPADLNGLVRFAERQNLVSARVPSHFKRRLRVSRTCLNITRKLLFLSQHGWRLGTYQHLTTACITSTRNWYLSSPKRPRWLWAPPTPSQWLQEALSSAGKRPGSEAILALPHPPSWRSRGLLYLYYEMIPDYISRRIKTRHCQIWSHTIIIVSRQQQDIVI